MRTDLSILITAVTENFQFRDDEKRTEEISLATQSKESLLRWWERFWNWTKRTLIDTPVVYNWSRSKSIYEHFIAVRTLCFCTKTNTFHSEFVVFFKPRVMIKWITCRDGESERDGTKFVPHTMQACTYRNYHHIIRYKLLEFRKIQTIVLTPNWGTHSFRPENHIARRPIQMHFYDKHIVFAVCDIMHEHV